MIRKKYLVVLVLVLVIMGICGCSKKKETLDNYEEYVTGYAYKVGYLNDISESDKKKVVSDYATFRSYFERNTNYRYDGNGNIVSSFCDEILNKYDEEYFSDKSLAILYISLGSGSITIEYKNAYIEDKIVKIKYDENVPEIGTMDMSGYFIIVEVPKVVEEIIVL